MFPGLGRGVDPKQMSAMMRQMGIKTTDIQATKVVVEKEDGSKLLVTSPTVTIMEVQGQKSLQVSGEFSQEASGEQPDATDSDIDLICSQTGVSKAQAQEALEQAKGDIAQAILSLQK